MKKILILFTICLFFSISIFAQKDYGFRVKGKYKYKKPYSSYVVFGLGIAKLDNYYPITSIGNNLVIPIRVGNRLGEIELAYLLPGRIDLAVNYNLLYPITKSNPLLCRIVHPFVGLGYSAGYGIYKNENKINVGTIIGGLQLTLPIRNSGFYCRGTYKTPFTKREDENSEIREGTFRAIHIDVGIIIEL